MINALTTWLYGGDPFEPLAFESPLSAIKQRLEDGERYFESLLKVALLENSHRSTVVLEPDPEMNRRLDDEESARLAAARSAMSAADFEAVAENERKLVRIQETPDSPEALATIPVLTLDDLEKENKPIPLEELDAGGVKLLYHDLFTNGIVYLDVSFDLSGVPQELLPYLSLFASGLVKMGTEAEDYVQLSQRIGRETGGVSPSLLIQNKYHSEELVARLVVRAKSTMDKIGEMLAILKDILLTTKYDNPERFKQILMEYKARMESALVPSGHAVVNRRLGAALSMSGWLSEQTQGLDNLFFSRALIDRMGSDWEQIAASFARIREAVVNRETMLINVTLDQENWQQVGGQLDGFVSAIPQREAISAVWTLEDAPDAEGLTIPAQVNYVGKGANLYKLGYQPDGSINVIRKYLGTTYIWEKIRVQGGAYGGFTVYDLHSGVFNFLSYRDPNLLGTLKNYDGTANFLRTLDLAESELVKSIIGTIGDMDAYQLPDAKGFTSMVRYLTGYGEEERQRVREQVLATTEKDFKALAVQLEKLNQTGKIAVLGSAAAIAEANQEAGDFLAVKTIL